MAFSGPRYGDVPQRGAKPERLKLVAANLNAASGGCLDLLDDTAQ
jgi:hypothetical protein